jgi:hypothetical protein
MRAAWMGAMTEIGPGCGDGIEVERAVMQLGSSEFKVRDAWGDLAFK